MEIYTIGFTKTTAEQFFGALKLVGVQQLIDVRLNNTSQLSGFARRQDLPYFLGELCQTSYRHEPLLAPTSELLTGYRKRSLTWLDFEARFIELLKERQVETRLEREMLAVPSVLLCSEHTAGRCHRRLVAEYLGAAWGDLQLVHLNESPVARSRRTPKVQRLAKPAL